MSTQDASALARRWWELIDKAAFREAAALAAPGAVIDWVLSNERMRIEDQWVAANENYPGSWRAEINEIVSEPGKVVTVTAVSDGPESVTAISMFTIEDGRIAGIVEYWPEPYPAPDWRRQWVSQIDKDGD